MTDNQIWQNLIKLRPLLGAYLAKERLVPAEPHLRSTVPCPNPDCENRDALLRGDEWSCGVCGANGDILNYVMLANPHFDKGIAIRYIHKRLGLKITQLDSMPVEELMQQHFRPRDYLVQDLIGQGLYLLVGASKIGKSWLVLDLAIRVSRGQPFWGLATSRGEVLYISLEDTPQRLQERLQTLLQGEEISGIHLATEAELMGQGFEEQIGGFLAEHKAVKLVIVDTLQKIRQLNKEENTYAGDYATVSALKRLADVHGVTLLLVHHTRKQGAEDHMDKISGTTGILGAADGSLLLEKHSRLNTEASLIATGRDCCDQKLELNFNTERCVWELQRRSGDPARERDDAVLLAAAELVEACGGTWEGRATELLAALEYEGEMTPTQLSGCLRRNQERLRRAYGLELSMTRNREKRLVHLGPAPSRDAVTL